MEPPEVIRPCTAGSLPALTSDLFLVLRSAEGWTRIPLGAPSSRGCVGVEFNTPREHRSDANVVDLK